MLSMQFVSDSVLSLSEKMTSWAQLSLFLSPSNRLAAVVANRTLIAVLSIISNQVICEIESSNVSQLLFGLNDSQVILNCGTSVKNYSLSSQSWSADIFGDRPQNQFTSLSLSPDLTQLFALNHSQLLSWHLFSGRQTSVLLPSDCLGNILFHENRLYTISYDCSICLFLSNRLPTLEQSTSLENCRYGQAVIVQNRIVLISDASMEEQTNLVALDVSTLAKVENYNISSFPLRVVWLQNYLLALKGQLVDVYRNNFGSYISTLTFDRRIADAAYAPLSKRVFFVLQSDKRPSVINSYSVIPQCSENNSFISSCTCDPGFMFQLSSGQCIKKECKSSQCQCPRFFVLDPFSLQCKLNCSLIYGSATLMPFGKPQQCLCNPPLSWNYEVGDCSFVDCSFVPHSTAGVIAPLCSCEDNFRWNSSSFQCIRKDEAVIEQSQSSSPVGLIIGLLFLLIILIVLLLMYLWKRNRQQTEEGQSPYVPYDVKKALDQLPTHRNLDEDNQGSNLMKKKPKKEKKKNSLKGDGL